MPDQRVSRFADYRLSMKRGRNDACYCGSGKKYKKCCLEDDKRPTLNAERDVLGNLIGRPFIDTIWEAQGTRVVAVGNRVYQRPPHETTHEFFIHLLRSEFGEAWHNEQIALPRAECHVVQEWLYRWFEAQRGADVQHHSEHRFSRPISGDLRALLCLGYDIYTLLHAQVLPPALVKRLRRADQFQGARYEAAVAAVFARAGYTLKWLNARDRKLPEFIAGHPGSGKELAVEAKSRHRPGVLGRPGEPQDAATLRADVGNLLQRALEKEVDGRPLVVCLDLNLPVDEERSLEEWGQELQARVFAPFEQEYGDGPRPFSAVFITNYSWHWRGRQPPGDPVSFVVVPHEAEVRLPHNEARLLAEALFQYGGVPAESLHGRGRLNGRKDGATG
jgi:hypothetical protein